MTRRQRIFAGVVVALLLLSGGTTLWMATCGFAGCPSLEQLRGFRPSEGSRVLDRNGTPLGRLDLRPADQRAAGAGAAPRARGVHRGRGPPLLLPWRHRLAERGTRPGAQLPLACRARGIQHHHHAGGAERLPPPSVAGALAPAQAHRDRAGPPARAGAVQAADPRALPQRDLSRQRHLRRRGGEPRPVRQERARLDGRGGGAPRRASARAIDLLAAPASRSGTGPPWRRARADGARRIPERRPGRARGARAAPARGLRLEAAPRPVAGARSGARGRWIRSWATSRDRGRRRRAHHARRAVRSAPRSAR